MTELKDGIDEYAWSPDSKRIALIMRDVARHDRLGEHETQADRHRPLSLQGRRQRLPRLDARAPLSVRRRDKKATLLTPGHVRRDAVRPGRPTASGSRSSASASAGSTPTARTTPTSRSIEARAGATPKQLTTFAGPDDGPLAWSPDGSRSRICSGSEPKFSAYNEERLAVVSVDGGAPRMLTGVARPSGLVAAFQRRRQVDHRSL